MTPLKTLILLVVIILAFIIGRKGRSRFWRRLRVPLGSLGIIAFGMIFVIPHVFNPRSPVWADDMIVTASRDNWRVHLIITNETPMQTPLTTVTVAWHTPPGIVAPPSQTYRVPHQTTHWEATWVEPLAPRPKSDVQSSLAQTSIIITLHGPGHNQTIVQRLGI